jgi:hypothetical protein
MIDNPVPQQPGFESHHYDDHEGYPGGGHSFGRGFAVSWQRGPLGKGVDRKPPNGAFVEDIIRVALDRLHYYQRGPFKCPENQAAIKSLEEALEHLQSRTQRRVRKGIEGTLEVE